MFLHEVKRHFLRNNSEWSESLLTDYWYFCVPLMINWSVGPESRRKHLNVVPWWIAWIINPLFYASWYFGHFSCILYGPLQSERAYSSWAAVVIWVHNAESYTNQTSASIMFNSAHHSCTIRPPCCWILSFPSSPVNWSCWQVLLRGEWRSYVMRYVCP